MKKLLLIFAIVLGWAPDAPAIKLCRTACGTYAMSKINNMKNNTDYSGQSTYSSQWDNAWNNGVWSVNFHTAATGLELGNIGGIAKCTTSGTDANAAPSANGTYCWCRVTSAYGDSNCVGPWVFNTNSVTPDSGYCWNGCTSYCTHCVTMLYSYTGSLSCTRTKLLQGL